MHYRDPVPVRWMDHISTRRSAFVAQAISPFNDVAAVTTPTLIVCGEKDWNVPVSQVELRLPVTVVVITTLQ